eukprot:c15692_g1_i1 orf=164-2194(-)
MYSDTFLTVCPACKTVGANLRTCINKEVTCTGCLSTFTAQENVIDVEDTFESHLIPLKETEVYFKGLQGKKTTIGSDKGECKDQIGLTSPDNNQKEVTKVCKEAMEILLVRRQDSLEVDAERPLSKAPAISNQKGEGVIESQEQHIKEECTDWIKETKEHHSDKAVMSFNEVTNSGKSLTKLSMNECLDERKGARGGTKSRKRKLSHNLASAGVALRKPYREKKIVRSYSPSREWIFKRKIKLGLQKGGEVSRTVVKKYKRNREEVKQQGENSFLAGTGDVCKGKTTADGTAEKPAKSDPEGYSDDFKQFMTEEIKRQVLDGLGDASKKALGEFQVVEVEEIRPCTASCFPDLKNAMPEEQRYIAKVKLMATLSFPLILRASQGPAEDFHKHMDHHQPQPPSGIKRQDSKVIEKLQSDESKGREATEDESKGREVTKEPDCTGLMEPERVPGEPLFENGNAEEVDVPESEFYDFECDRSEDKFAPGQVWASYDSGQDGMPRDYVQIKKVMSVNPFKVQIALLKPEDFSEWIKLGNSLTCGEFSTESRPRAMDQIDGFSHIMKWEKGQNGMICIYPAEREVWALYKNWSEIDPSRRIKLGYEIVQVVAIKKEDWTVSVVPLVNYKGSRTVFILQETEPFQIPKRDFIRFSHQIPTYKILGAEDFKDCVELDPAATPH